MKNYLYSFTILLFVLLLGSCREDFNFEPSKGNLEFSRDTVFLDTIFTNIGSSTYTLKVYNNSNKNIQIPSLKLGKGEESKYRLMVDGVPGKVFNNVGLLAKDSLFIFIETTIDYNEYKNDKSEYLYTDRIEFGSGNKIQKVELATLVRDAYFLYPQRKADGSTEKIIINDDEISGFYLSENNHNGENTLLWKNDKAYVIYGYAAVPPNKTLSISEGAEIYFHDNSGLIVSKNANIEAAGTIEKPISFQGDRLESVFDYVSGQWGKIWLVEGSSGTFTNAIIINPTIGLHIEKNINTIELHNVQIYNATQNGILAKTAKIYGTNLVIGNSGITSLNCTLGGEYEFLHSSFVNYWNNPSQNSVSIDDGDGTEEFEIKKAVFENCILYGSSPQSLILQATSAPENFKIQFKNTLIKHSHIINLANSKFPYNYKDTSIYNNIFLATTDKEFKPDFFDPKKNQLMITDKSTDIMGKGSVETAQKVPLDISGIERLSSPDLGAYQNVTQAEE